MNLRYILPMLLFGFIARSQALHSVNYNYLYDSSTPFTFDLRITQQPGHLLVQYALIPDAKAGDDQKFDLKWELRKGFDDPGNTLFVPQRDTSTLLPQGNGQFYLSEGDTAKILVARVIDWAQNRSWYFPRPVSWSAAREGYITASDATPLLTNYLTSETAVIFEGVGDHAYATLYTHEFPAASPAYAERQASVSARIVPDTIFEINGNQRYRLSRPGLYLLQRDTTTTKGLTFRVELDYPKYRYLDELPAPLIYISTRDEFGKLTRAADDKEQFDRIVLGITGDEERARAFIRSYFRRVELANQFFTSYKEGWKTDRGMMLIIFGPPQEVYLFGEREIWQYADPAKFQCEFVRAPTLFDAANFVLIRSSKLQKPWMETVDLWRKARF